MAVTYLYTVIRNTSDAYDRIFSEVLAAFTKKEDAIKFEHRMDKEYRTNDDVWHDTDKIPFNMDYENMRKRVMELEDLRNRLEDGDTNTLEFATCERELILLEKNLL